MNNSTFTFGASIKGRKKTLKKFHELVYPRTRPKQVHPKKRVKWRLVSKWFNRYEKLHFIGQFIKAEEVNGGDYLMSTIRDIRIKKAGGHRRTFLIDSIPTTLIHKSKIHKPKSEKSCK